MIKRNKVPERLWECPESGYGEYQNRFDEGYDYAEELLRRKRPFIVGEDGWIKDKYHSETSETACEISEVWLEEWLWNNHKARMVGQRPFKVTCPKCLATERFNCIRCYSATHNDSCNDPFEPFAEPVMCMNCGETYQVDKNMRFEN